MNDFHWVDEVLKKKGWEKSGFQFSARSLSNLEGVHQDLVDVAALALQLTEVDFVVTEGLRSKKRQKELVATGASQTMNSRHLTGHAIDLAALKYGTVSWSWPLYEQLDEAMKAAAKELGIALEWGGEWKFRDGPHFQLPWRTYPK